MISCTRWERCYYDTHNSRATFHKSNILFTIKEYRISSHLLDEFKNKDISNALVRTLSL